ncbi:hypothetical protein JRF73_00480 [Staphylococcus saprophyticus]|uniref:hypothetical protein n=1 Tax=Staphylococcus saprophyticus TaxID=29385 RepID=UPI0019CFACA9|nr:hypothetical protein [Staphylococcus saprophyticus]MBN6849447.1 hypothetical protein [Staphylococcus saprophyticus]
MKDREYKDAWQELKETLMQKYPEFCYKADVSNGDWEKGFLLMTIDILQYMDSLDNTNEFSNLLSDLEDNQND